MIQSATVRALTTLLSRFLARDHIVAQRDSPYKKRNLLLSAPLCGLENRTISKALDSFLTLYSSFMVSFFGPNLTCMVSVFYKSEKKNKNNFR